MERVSSREQEAAQNVLMTYMAKLQDALQETVVAIGDVIRVHASKMRKIHDAREYSGTWSTQQWQTLRRHNIQLQTKELQKLDESVEREWHDQRAAAAEHLADARLELVDSQLKQLPERIKSEVRAAASEAIVAKIRGVEVHDDGPAAKTRWDEFAMVTAAVDTAITKQLQAVKSRCMKMIKGTKSEWMRSS